MSPPDWYIVERLPWPIDWVTHFGRKAPLYLEIGFGSGSYLLDLAARHPEADIIGLEISIPSLRNAVRKLYRRDLRNVMLLQADAAAALQLLVTPASLAFVVINFPDPWPKKHHQRRRLINDEFLQLLATRMHPGAKLEITTDHAEYADHVSVCLESAPYFSSRNDTPVVFDDPGRLRTKYELVARAQGRSTRYFKWQRNELPANNRFPVLKEFPMPHVVFRLPASLDDIGECFRPGARGSGAVIVRYIGVYRALQKESLLIETYIKEEPITQRIGLEVRQRGPGEYIIALADIGYPRPTLGVQLAIHNLVELLRESFPSLVVVRSNLRGAHADYPD
jgi:tRNA (guanine-N7-)-methyltransferase